MVVKVVRLLFSITDGQNAEANPGFSEGGGGMQQIMCAHTRRPKNLMAVFQGPLKGPESSRAFLMLSEPFFNAF